MELLEGPVRVSVPATSANLGPGYDALGLALSLRDVVHAEVVDGPGPQIEVEGEGAGSVALDASHLVHRAMARGFASLGLEVPVVRLRCRNAIPHGRGLGSSSAAIVAGLGVTRALLVGGEGLLPDHRVFELAAELEGHPDNVAPAALGGFTVAYADGDGFDAVRVETVPGLRFAVFVPSEPVLTSVARGLLPATVPHADAARNAGRAALMVAALAGRPDRLLAATEDLLHQSYRAPAMPDSAALVARLRRSGVPAVISGAGPTVLAVVADPAARAPRAGDDATASAEDREAVDARMAWVLEHCPEGWGCRALDLETAGLRSAPL